MDETKSLATSSLFNVIGFSSHGRTPSSTLCCLLQANDKGSLVPCTGGLWVWSFSTGKDLRGDWARLLETGEENEARGEACSGSHGKADVKAHLHPSGLGSNATSSDDSSNSWFRLGLSTLIKCSVSTLCFPCLKFLTAVFNTSYQNACLTPHLLLYCSPMMNRICLAHSGNPGT